MTLFTVNVLGIAREITRTYPDGSYDCPHCGYAVHVRLHQGCDNGSCAASTHALANPAVTRPIFAAIETKRQQLAAEERQRQLNHEWAMERIEEERAERERIRNHVALKAKSKGACVECALHSIRYGGPPHFTVHRKPCPRARPTR